jgi:hypothetical protein
MSRAAKVWFSTNGVRYAVVTLQDREAWLASILNSWPFTA